MSILSRTIVAAALTVSMAALAGCVVEPIGGGGGYYAEPAPVYVAPAPFYIGPGYGWGRGDRDWHGGGGGWHHHH
jgi:hypothetical protein